VAKKSPTIHNPSELRKAAATSQTEFWKKFGVTQSGGSRYESGRSMPTPLKLLMQAQMDGVIDEAILAKLLKKATSAK
jgi:transcriptional regulator with XRE-family HTH domain